MAKLNLELNENEAYNVLLGLSDSIEKYERMIERTDRDADSEDYYRANLLDVIELKVKVRDAIRAINWEDGN
jgi:hypothetical protein